MATFTGTGADEIIAPTFVSGSVTPNPAGSLPGDGADTLLGGGGNDILNGGGGADSMSGGGGNDTFYVDNAGDVVTEAAGEGDQDGVVSSVSFTLSGQVENLGLFGSANVRGTGNAKNNGIFGNSGNNVLAGKDGDDIIEGGAGNDTLQGGNGEDFAVYVNATAGVTVSLATTGVQNTGGAGTDKLSGFEHLIGSEFDDTLTGNAGNNRIDGGGGADAMNGGAGDDSYAVNHAGDTVIDSAGNDTVWSTITLTLAAGLENLVLSVTLDDIDGTGNDLVNQIIGNGGDNILSGLGGDDLLLGSLGADTLIGGTGNDTYLLDDDLDTIVEAASAGTDTVVTDGSFVLGANLENLQVGGNGTGNALANAIVGLDANNVLSGLGGSDTLLGGLGNDALQGGNGNDTASYELTGLGGVTVALVAGAQNTGGQGIDTLSGIENLTGSEFNDTLTGNNGGNVLEGRAGNDTLLGGGGNDTLGGGGGLDNATGGAGTDTFRFDTALVAGVVATITDMTHGIDRIALAQAVFAQAGALGTLAAAAFHTGAAAHDADDRIVYNSATGDLLYDADGTGAQAAAVFGKVGAGLALTNTDFRVV